jgi:hypothetical protein
MQKGEKRKLEKEDSRPYNAPSMFVKEVLAAATSAAINMSLAMRRVHDCVRLQKLCARLRRFAMAIGQAGVKLRSAGVEEWRWNRWTLVKHANIAPEGNSATIAQCSGRRCVASLAAAGTATPATDLHSA